MPIIRSRPRPEGYWKYNTKEEKIIMSEKIRVLLDEETVEKRICEIAAKISEDVQRERNPHDLCT